MFETNTEKELGFEKDKFCATDFIDFLDSFDNYDKYKEIVN